MAKKISAAVYVLGCAILTMLLGFCVFGSTDSRVTMISQRDSAMFDIALGFMPMLIASLTFYYTREKRSKRRFWLIMIPGVICLGFAVPWIIGIVGAIFLIITGGGAR